MFSKGLGTILVLHLVGRLSYTGKPTTLLFTRLQSATFPENNLQSHDVMISNWNQSAYRHWSEATLVSTLLSFSALSPAAFSEHPPLPAAEAAQRTSPGDQVVAPSLKSQQQHHRPALHPLQEHHHRRQPGVKVYWQDRHHRLRSLHLCVRLLTGLCAGRRARRAHSFVVRQCTLYNTAARPAPALGEGWTRARWGEAGQGENTTPARAATHPGHRWWGENSSFPTLEFWAAVLFERWSVRVEGG